MRYRLIVIALLGACQPFDDPPPDVSKAESSILVGSYNATSNTSNATVNYSSWTIGPFDAWTTVVVGTCGVPGASFSNDTFLRVFENSAAWTEVDHNDNACDASSTGSLIVHTLPRSGSLMVRAGCAGSTLCSGTIHYLTLRDTNPRLADLVDAFDDIGTAGTRLDVRDDGAQAIAVQPDPEHHFQGVARFSDRTYWDFAVSADVPGEGDVNLWFGRFDSSTAAAKDPFGSNADMPGTDPDDGITEGAHVGDDPALSHAGGMQSIGDYLFVAAEASAKGSAAVEGFDTTTRHADSIGVVVEREEGGGAWVAVTKRGPAPGPGESILAMVAGFNTGAVDVYVVEPGASFADIREPWGEPDACWHRTDDDVTGCPELCRGSDTGGDMTMGQYQGASLITDQNGTVFLIGFANEGGDEDSDDDDWVDLWRVVFNGEFMPSGNSCDSFTCPDFLCLVKTGRHVMTETDIDHLTFHKGTGAYYVPGSDTVANDDSIFVYSTDDDICGDVDCDGTSTSTTPYLKLNEFVP